MRTSSAQTEALLRSWTGKFQHPHSYRFPRHHQHPPPQHLQPASRTSPRASCRFLCQPVPIPGKRTITACMLLPQSGSQITPYFESRADYIKATKQVKIRLSCLLLRILLTKHVSYMRKEQGNTVLAQSQLRFHSNPEQIFHG